jgi:hypothetical protein
MLTYSSICFLVASFDLHESRVIHPICSQTGKLVLDDLVDHSALMATQCTACICNIDVSYLTEGEEGQLQPCSRVEGLALGLFSKPEHALRIWRTN